MYKNEMTWRIRVYGIVQGVGFRPTVSRHATNHGIYGTVCNKGPYVEIYAQGTKEQIEGFLNSLKKQKGKSLFPRILQSAMRARQKCLTRKTDGICIRLSTSPAVDQGLRFWMLCRMTGNAQV